jgi:hypothetical protein
MVYVPGPFDSAHLYVQWGGKLPGAEDWSCGLRLRKKTAGNVDSGAGLLVGIGAAIATFHQDLNARISQAAKLQFVKVNAIGTDGKYREASTNQALYADLPGQMGGAQKYPNQIAWAISLTTGFGRGPAHRGRFYVPLPMPSLEADGRITDAEADAMHTTAQTLITNINAVNADYEVAVFSRKLGGATNRKVTGVAVGRVLDTQRRRRRSLAEDYQ